MIEIDGSYGEGGGQVIRSSLALSILTRKPLRVTNIRQNRTKPGLQPQHLKAVDAAAAICRAEVRGAALNSRQLSFTPGELRSGRYKFEIGTAGSTALLSRHAPGSAQSSANARRSWFTIGRSIVS